MSVDPATHRALVGLLSTLPLPVAQVLRRALSARAPTQRHQLAFAAAEAMLKIAAACRVGVYLDRCLATDSTALRSRLEALVLPSAGHWLGLLRDLSARLASAERGMPLASTCDALVEPRPEWAGVSSFLEAAVEEEILSAEAARQARKRGVLGFFEALVTYRNAVIGHGSPRPPGFYDRFADLLLGSLAEVATDPSLLGDMDLAVGRWSLGSGAERPRLSWQILRGLAGLPGTVLGASSEEGRLDEACVAGRVYLTGPGTRVSLHPLLVFVEDEEGRERVGLLNRAVERRSKDSSQAEITRAEYLEYDTGEPLAGVDARAELAELLTRVRGEVVSEAEVLRTMDRTRGLEASEPARLPRQGEVFDDFRIEAELGRGGMGVVYRAHQLSLDRPVALKVIRGASDEVSKARFLREARSMARLSHPNVVEVHAFGEHEGSPYLAMKYVDGESLADRLQRDGPLPLDDALGITAGIVAALTAAERHGIVHRDLKPSNVMLASDGGVLVSDFGLATGLQQTDAEALSEAGGFVGTPHYASPEQIRGEAVDARSDLYSLGVVLYEMLAGRRPFADSSPYAVGARHLHDELPAITEARPEVPRAFGELLAWLTAKQSDARPASASELAEELERLRAGEGALTSRGAGSRPSWLSREVVVLATAFVIGVALVVIGWLQARAAQGKEEGDGPGLVVAVTPFYGPDTESEREGRVMAAMVEREVREQLGPLGAEVIGIDETGEYLRDHDAARELGERLGATVVVWGDAYVLRGEAEIQPYLTIVPQKGEDDRSVDPLSDLRARAFGSVEVSSEADNQIELRRTSAEGVGSMVLLLAGLHALHGDGDVDRALEILGRAPRTGEVLRAMAQAHLSSEDEEQALAVFGEAVAMDPSDAEAHGAIGDVHVKRGELEQAVAAYRAAEATGREYKTTAGRLFEGLLYTGVYFRTTKYKKGALVQAPYLLVRRPTDFVVQKRVPLPGLLTEFDDGSGSLGVSVQQGHSAVSTVSTLRVQSGRVMGGEPSLCLNLVQRLWGVRSGFVPAYNFLDSAVGTIVDIDWVFEPSDEPDSGLATNFDDLEARLHGLVALDPTQPWNRFLLAISRRVRGDLEGADSHFNLLTGGRWTGTPYYEFAWMAGIAERLEFFDWSDELFDLSLEKYQGLRYSRLPVVGIEQMVSFPPDRIAGVRASYGLEQDRAHQLLKKRVEATGVTDVDPERLAPWLAYNERAGLKYEAVWDREWLSQALQHPYAWSRYQYVLDAAVMVLFAVAIGFLLTTLMIEYRGFSLDRVPGLQPVAIVAADVTLRVLMAVGVFWLTGRDGGIVFDWGLALVLAVVVASGPAFLVHRQVSARARNLGQLGIAFACVAGAYVLMIGALQQRMAGEAVPVGLHDAMGSPAVRTWLDRLQKDQGDTQASLLLRGVHCQIAGDWDGAREAYRAVRDDPRAGQALQEIEKGIQRPSIEVGAEDVMAAVGTGSVSRNLRVAFDPHIQWSPAFFEIAILVSRAAFVLFMLVGIHRWQKNRRLSNLLSSREESVQEARGMESLVRFFPAVNYVRRGKILAAWAIVSLTVFTGLGLWVLGESYVSSNPFIGPFSADQGLGLRIMYPMQEEDTPARGETNEDRLEKISATYYWPLLMMYPTTRLYLAALVVASLATVSVHGWSIIRAVREAE